MFLVCLFFILIFILLRKDRGGLLKMNYKTKSHLDDNLITLLDDIQKDNVFHSIHELDEYIRKRKLFMNMKLTQLRLEI